MRTLPGSTRRQFALVAVALFASTALSACGGTADSASGGGSGGGGQLIAYDGGGVWGAAQRKAFYDPFEKETGIKVVSAPAPTPAQLQTAIETGNPGIDLYDLSGTDLGAWREAGLVQQIDYSGWPAGATADFTPYPTLPEAVPSLIFAQQIAYDPSTTKAPITSWADFFNTSKFPGKRTLGDPSANISSGTIEAALLADGVPADQLYPLDVDRAFRKLSAIKPQILKFWQTGAESVQLLTDKQVSATGAWNGRVAGVAQQGAKVESTWNQAILEVDYWVIPKGAKNAAAASRLIEFASRPDRQAAFSQLITYSPTNSKAYAQIPADRQALLPSAPDHVARTLVSNNDFWSSKAPSGKAWSAEIVDRWQAWLTQG